MDFFTSRRQVIITASVIGMGASGLASLSGCSTQAPEPVAPDRHLVETLQHARFLHDSASQLQADGVGNSETWQYLIDDYDAHIETLQRLLRPDDGPQALDSPLPKDLEGYQESLEAAIVQSTESCLESSSEMATLLGEITACRHGHLGLLL